MQEIHIRPFARGLAGENPLATGKGIDCSHTRIIFARGDFAMLFPTLFSQPSRLLFMLENYVDPCSVHLSSQLYFSYLVISIS
jgi:hypothetical protein